MNIYNRLIKPILFGIYAGLFLMALIVSIAKINGYFLNVEWLEVFRLASESIALTIVADWVGIKFLE